MKQFVLLTALAACGAARPSTSMPGAYDALTRDELNRWAVRTNTPLYWTADRNANRRVDPDEVAALLFYPTSETYVGADGRFTAAFDRAYAAIVAASRAPAPADERQRWIARDLDQGRPTLVATDLRTAPAHERAFVGHMLTIAGLIDALYADHNGSAALVAQLPPGDPASASAFRRNRGPRCAASTTEHEPACTAIPGARAIYSIYPAALQTAPDFCAQLEKRPDAETLLSPFTVVRAADDGTLRAVPYPEAYPRPMAAIAAELTAAADAIAADPAEQALVAYLRAAATAFGTNRWEPADEAWAKMSVDNSKWYVRVGPDETYWEPCNHKAGFHLTFARINQGSRTWQQKLVPIQQDMEQLVAARVGAPYAARKVTFHLPDFIDIVVNAGDDRTPFHATIGQSLPNWGPVANEGRGRTIAMANLYTDADSRATRRTQAASLFDAATLAAYADDSTPGLLTTILHEVMHNLGPSHEYAVAGKDARAAFGGPVASVLEELKAQAGALFLLGVLRERGLIADELARRAYVDAVVWGFGHIAEGMYEQDGKRRTYSQVAAAQNGFLIDRGALVWDPAATAANGTDKGAFRVDLAKMPEASAAMIEAVGGIKARNDAAAATALLARHVDGTVVPQAQIRERFRRVPAATLVYSVAR